MVSDGKVSDKDTSSDEENPFFPIKQIPENWRTL